MYYELFYDEDPTTVSGFQCESCVHVNYPGVDEHWHCLVDEDSLDVLVSGVYSWEDVPTSMKRPSGEPAHYFMGGYTRLKEYDGGFVKEADPTFKDRVLSPVKKLPIVVKKVEKL